MLHICKNMFLIVKSTSIEVRGEHPEGKSLIYRRAKDGFEAVYNSSLSDRVAGGGGFSLLHEIS